MAASMRESYAGDDVESTDKMQSVACMKQETRRRTGILYVFQIVEKREAGSERKAPKVVEQ